MTTYVAKRLFLLVSLIWVVSTLTFSLLYMTGDPVLALIREGATSEDIEFLRHKLGYDRPFLVQYIDFIKDIFFEGSFGKSIRHQEEALRLVIGRLPATIELTLAAMLFSVIFGVPIGIYSAKYSRSWIGASLTGFTTFSLAVPQFWLGIILMLIFGYFLKWFPLSGRGGWSHVVLPALAIGISTMAYLARITKTLILEQLSQDYIRTAQAKGQTPIKILHRHALRNAALPIVTLIGLNLGFLLGGAVIIEQIFAWPGIGRFMLQAIENRDFPVVQASVFVIALSFGVINFLTDMIYMMIDPRIRYS